MASEAVIKISVSIATPQRRTAELDGFSTCGTPRTWFKLCRPWGSMEQDPTQVQANLLRKLLEPVAAATNIEPVRTQSIPSSASPFYLRSSDFHIPSDSCPRPYPNGIMMSHKLLPLFVSTLFLVFIEQSLWFPVTLDTAEPCDGWIFPSITGSGYGPSVTLLAQGSLWCYGPNSSLLPHVFFTEKFKKKVTQKIEPVRMTWASTMVWKISTQY